MAPFLNIKENKMWNSNMRNLYTRDDSKKIFHILSLAALAQVQGSFLYQNEVDTFFAPFIWLWEFFCQNNCLFKVWRVSVYVAMVFHYSFWSENVILSVRYETYIMLTKFSSKIGDKSRKHFLSKKKTNYCQKMTKLSLQKHFPATN